MVTSLPFALKILCQPKTTKKIPARIRILETGSIMFGNMTLENISTPVNGDKRNQSVATRPKPKIALIVNMVNGKPYISI